jgi:gamma-glutamyltranspeptidase/glutathione hydrolase
MPFHKEQIHGKSQSAARLISKAYGTARRALIDVDQAADGVAEGDPKLVQGDTICLSVVDKDRNCCALIQSTFLHFGSKMTPGDLGFTLQNRGALFALDDDHPNRLEPHKRPFHTIIPVMVTTASSESKAPRVPVGSPDQGVKVAGRPVLTFGVMGGDMQPQGHVQILINLMDFGMNIQAAGDAARVRHIGGATPTGSSEAGVGLVTIESGISKEAVAVLKSKGHKVARVTGGFGGYQAIQIDWKNNVLHGATEPRKDGAAVGY